MSIRTRRNSKRLLAGVLAGAFALSGVAVSSQASADEVSADANFERIAGADRYATAVAVANEITSDTLSDIGTVILATGTNFPDGLAASGLVGGLNGAAPNQATILLTETNALPTATANAIAAMTGLNLVVVMGGTAAISDAVISEITTLQGWTADQAANQIVRINGANRYDTALKAVETWVSLGGSATAIDNCAIVVTGENFPDALAAGSLAVNNSCPILLNSGSTVRPEVTAGLAAIGSATNITVVGGTTVVPNSVIGQLRADGHTVTRVSGANRYATAQAVANRLNTTGTSLLPTYTSPDQVVVASGENFPDALSAAAFTFGGVPILLTQTNAMPPATAAWLTANNNALNIGGTEPVGVYLMGGTAAVSATTATAVRTAATAVSPTVLSTLGLIVDTVEAEAVEVNLEFTANPDGRLAGVAGNGWTIDVAVTASANAAPVINNQTKTITVRRAQTTPAWTEVTFRSYWNGTAALSSLFLLDNELIPSPNPVTEFAVETAGGGNEGFVVAVLNSVCERGTTTAPGGFPTNLSVLGNSGLVSGALTNTPAANGQVTPVGWCGNNTQQNFRLWDNPGLVAALQAPKSAGGPGLTDAQVQSVAALLPAAPLMIIPNPTDPFDARYQRLQLDPQVLRSTATPSKVNTAIVRSNITWVDVEL